MSLYAANSLISPPKLSILLTHKLKLGIMASGNGSNFEAIAKAIDSNQLNAELRIVIYNNPQAMVKTRANHWGVKSLLLDHRNYSSREALDKAIIEVFEAEQVEWIIMAGWMRIVTEVLLNSYPDRILNIHPSLLPSFKGLHAVEMALAAGVKITGCTVHLASLEVDSGIIIMQAAVPVLADDTVETLHTRIQKQEHEILPGAIALAAQLYS